MFTICNTLTDVTFIDTLFNLNYQLFLYGVKSLNFSKLFRKKAAKTPENRRSGDDQRQQNAHITDEKREKEDRRTVLQDYNKKIEQFRKIPMFMNLSNDHLMKILRVCSKVKYPGMHYLYHAGEESKDMHILLKGRLKIMFRTGEVWKTITPFVNVGEMGFFTGTHRSTDIIADTECLLLKLNKVEISRLFINDKELHIKILENVIKGLTKNLLSDYKEMEQLYDRIRSIDII